MSSYGSLEAESSHWDLVRRIAKHDQLDANYAAASGLRKVWAYLKGGRSNKWLNNAM